MCTHDSIQRPEARKSDASRQERLSVCAPLGLGSRLVTEVLFEKYDKKGAYHWADYSGGLMRMNAYTRARYDLVVDCLKNLTLAPEARVLDVGCGDGALSGLIRQELGQSVTGVDANPLAIDLARDAFARRGLDGQFKCITGYDTGEPENRFDAAVCSDVIEHVLEPLTMLTEIYRVLRPGGHLVITTPIRFSHRPVDPMHVQEWFTSDFVELCGKIFGSPIHVYETHPIFWYELLTIRKTWVGRVSRLLVNTATLLGYNPFRQKLGLWRCCTTQTLVLRKSPGDLLVTGKSQ
jgi:2-polyprenyl-3-methyl-5-hydroxy-6-metoxy-1,4-benzoquinol methylase